VRMQARGGESPAPDPTSDKLSRRCGFLQPPRGARTKKVIVPSAGGWRYIFSSWREQTVIANCVLWDVVGILRKQVWFQGRSTRRRHRRRFRQQESGGGGGGGGERVRPRPHADSTGEKIVSASTTRSISTYSDCRRRKMAARLVSGSVAEGTTRRPS